MEVKKFYNIGPWSIRQQGKTWAEFSNLEGPVCVRMHLCCYEAKLPNLKLKTQRKLVLDHLQSDIAFPGANVMKLYLS